MVALSVLMVVDESNKIKERNEPVLKIYGRHGTTYVTLSKIFHSFSSQQIQPAARQWQRWFVCGFTD
jgi:hypothetical protein